MRRDQTALAREVRTLQVDRQDMDGTTSDRQHAERMDAFYRTHRHLYDLTRPFFLLGRNAMVDGLDPPSGGSILEIGCGTASNLIRAAKRRPDVSLYGMDISDEMLATARSSISRNGLSGRIAVAQGDAGSFDPEALFGMRTFDCIMFSYTLSMMPPWKEALDLAMTMLSPGGSMHVVDFGQHERLPSLVRRLHLLSIRGHDVHPRPDLHVIMLFLTRRRRMDMEFHSTHRGYSWRFVARRR